MLIDVNQIIPKTKLREQLTDALALVRQGKELVISDRGQIVAKMVPIKKKERDQEKLIKEMNRLAKKMDKYSSQEDSTDFIRRMRDTRIR